MEGCPGHVHTNPNTGAKTTYILDICIKRNLVWCIWFRFTHSHEYAKATYFANYWLVGMRKPSPRCDFAAFLSIVVAKSTTIEHNGQACLYRRRQELVCPGRTLNFFFNEVQNEGVLHDFVSNWTISQSVWIKSWSLNWCRENSKIYFKACNKTGNMSESCKQKHGCPPFWTWKFSFKTRPEFMT